ncbi:MAG: tyrosine-type recombinase/integrase [Desulfobacteraceae bacterium]|nr:tyrosine-type recombinase/integrase [Desulfobacteraceae bacterium]
MSIHPLNDKRTKWQIYVYPRGGKGKRLKVRFQGNEAEARTYEAELRNKGNVEIEKDCKVADIYNDWLYEYTNNNLPNTIRDAKNCYKQLLPFFGLKRFSLIKPKIIEQYKAKRLEDGVCKRTINKELSYFSSLWHWAHESGFAEDFLKIKKFSKVSRVLPAIPTPQEVEAIYQAIDEKYKTIFLLLYDAGMRRTETLTLKKKNIYLNKGDIITVRKGGHEKLIPIITERLHIALETAIKDKDPDDYLFINPSTGKPWYSIRKALLKAAKKAEVNQRVYHHLFRHSLGTHALEAGVDIKALQGIFGHSTVKTTEWYSQLRSSFVKREGSKFNDFIVNKK